MPFRLRPRDTSFFDLFTASAENLVAATDVVASFVRDIDQREQLAGRLRELEHVGDETAHTVFKQASRPRRPPPAS